ncbi:MAG: OsmC family protein [Gammaproteobacteria bacterium]|nr:OsmC family protein [Gammaproteobacteria bacterium]
MTGTLGGALEARGIPAGQDRLTSEVEGGIDKEDGVLVIRTVHVRYHLRMEAGKEDRARRAHEIHHPYCPVYRTLVGCVEFSTELVIEIVS